MIEKIKSKASWLLHGAAYTGLIIYGANLLIEHGEMKATGEYQVIIIQDLTDKLGECD